MVVVTYNSANDIRGCLRSALAAGAEVLVVDNGSRDGTLSILESEFPDTQVLENPLNGYARAANLGFRNSQQDLVVLSNADVIYPADSLEHMLDYMAARPEIGVVGPQQVFENGRWQRSWGTEPGIVEALLELSGFTTLHNALRRAIWPLRLDRRPADVGFVDGAVMVIRRAAWESVNGLDQSFPFYAEESDFCIRVRKRGWRVVAYPDAIVMHKRGGSSTLTGMTVEHHVAAMVRASQALLHKHHHARYCALYFRLKIWFHRVKVVSCQIARAIGTPSVAQSASHALRIHQSYLRHLKPLVARPCDQPSDVARAK